MQNIRHTSSKKNTGVAHNSNLTQQYKSQIKQGQNNNAPREGFAFQNMKQFKCQIDHQIAKCLDTLDRQGLKFLKETLRASKLFGLNTQELANTQSIQQNIQSLYQQEPVVQKLTQNVKKIQPIKPNVQIKKVKKAQVLKKAIPIKGPSQNADDKVDMNQKIIKKLQSLNIKTGKKAQNAKPVKKQVINSVKINKVQIKNNIKYIEQEIEEQFQKDEEPQNAQIIQQSIKLAASNIHNSSQIKKQKVNIINSQLKQKPSPLTINKNAIQPKQLSKTPINESKIVQQSIRYTKPQATIKTQQIQLLKPFCKKQFKKHPHHHHQQGKNHRQNKDYGIEISKQDEFKKQINDEQQLKQEIQPVQNKNIVTYNESSKRNTQIQENSYNGSIIKHSDPYMQNLINKINKLSPTKRSKLEKILDKLEDPQNIANPSFLETSKMQENFILPFKTQKPMIINHVQQKQKLQKSKSRSKLQKQQKATSLKNSLIKKSFHSNIISSQNQKKQDQKHPSNNIFLNTPKKQQKKQDKNVLQLYQNTKSQVISSQRNISNINQQQPIKNYQTNNIQLRNSININQELNRSQLGTKLIKINKKKNQLFTLQLNLISNNGHPSLIGLNSIQIFNLSGQIIKIDESHLKLSNNNKILRLFTQNINNTEGWLTNLSTATIKIQNITQNIGGIRINNWNKSQLQADRQADMAQLLVNDQLYWRGQLKGGSFKENQAYSTDIKITQKHFIFPNVKNISQINIQEEPLFVKNNSSLKSSSIKNKYNVQKNNEVCWLQNEDFEKKMKEIEEQDKKVTQIKRIQSIRTSNINFPNESKLQFNVEVKDQFKPIHFNSLNIRNHQDLFKNNENPFKNNEDIFKNNDDPFKNNQSIRFPEKTNKSNLKSSLNEHDILGSLKKEISMKKKKQQASSASKLKKDDQIKKQRQQDQQFQKILKGLQKPQIQQRQQFKIQRNVQKVSQNIVKKQKNVAQLSFEQFMKDSLFDEKPKAKNFQLNNAKEKQNKFLPLKEEKIQQQSKRNNKIDIDNLIDELNDVVGLENNQQTGEQFYIPQLPKGKELSLILLSNWGHQNSIGINGIEIIDSQGNNIKQLFASSNNINSKQLNQKLFKHELLTSDEKNQIKFQKNKRISINISFSQKIQIAMIRIWNYNGHRVHNNIGIKKCHIKLDGNYIFSGQIQSSSGSLQDSKKNTQNILFTQNSQILKKIKEKDWLSKIKSKVQEQKQLFKTTIKNFFRPPTRNDDQNSKKIMQQIEINKKQIKLHKRNCFQYDPPLLPEGFVLKFILHNGWGDRFFIGLNGIQVFNEKGQNITNKNLAQIRADPSSISKLQGYQRDKRVINNLINGKNNTTSDNNIWLAPFLSDVQKVEKGRANTIIMDYSKQNKISAINFYNYIKTPQRGVREIEIFLDNILLYRGYLRKYNPQEKIIHTTINFTKQQQILELVNYMGYNEDNLQQQVGLVNQQKVIRSASIANSRSNHHLLRPMTGKLFQ